jgi:protein-S-isoprenylcysteine O-methyltransferase Ste14
MSDEQAYGLWPLVILNSFVFIIFAFSFAQPQSKRDWRSLGAFSAFIIALFTEMYGYPLTIFLLSGWIQSRFPALDPFTHNAGHLWHTLFRLKGDPHFDVFHILSYVFIGGGFWLLSAAWDVLHKAQKGHRLATSGVYASIRHPQYVAFIVIMIGFVLQWPTILTLVMFPILIFMYTRLALSEEQEMHAQFGAEYDGYAARTPRFFPHLGGGGSSAQAHG